MVQDLNMTGHDYNIALFIFFVPYILFEVPSNIIIKRIAPSTWLSIIMVKSRAFCAPNNIWEVKCSEVDLSRCYGVSLPSAKAWSITSAA